MTGAGQWQRGDSARAVAHACDLVRTFVAHDPAAQCRVEHFLSTPKEYVIQVRINLQAKAATQSAEVRLAKEEREATVRVIPNL
jgi:hypothetical protein